MLIAQGESSRYVCDQMGHSSIQVTFDTYGHLFPQAKQEASSKLEQTMFAKRKEPSVENLVEKGSTKRPGRPQIEQHSQRSGRFSRPVGSFDGSGPATGMVIVSPQPNSAGEMTKREP